MNKKLRNAVRADAERARAKRKQEQQLTFAQKYSKVKKYDFPAKENIHMSRHFYFPKIFGPGEFGSRWSKAAIAVYPVLCSRANFEHNDWFQISQENIGKMAGISTGTVQKGIEDIVTGEYNLRTNIDEKRILVPLLEARKTTEGTRHFYLYRAGFIRKDMMETWKGVFFRFYTCLIDSGIWAELRPRAKALYLTMRCEAIQDFEFYMELEELNGFEWTMSQKEYLQTRKWTMSQKEYLQTREWDVVETSMAELGRMSGIAVTNIKPTLEQLGYYRLVERVDRWYKVFLKPKIR